MFNLNRCDISIPMLFYSVYKCSRTVLWSTFYNSTKSYKLEQRISQGSRQARRGSESAKRNLTEHLHRFNRCTTGASAHTCAWELGWPELPAQWSGNLTHSNTFFNRRTTGARTFTRLCTVYPVNPIIGLPYKCLLLKVFY